MVVTCETVLVLGINELGTPWKINNFNWAAVDICSLSSSSMGYTLIESHIFVPSHAKNRRMSFLSLSLQKTKKKTEERRCRGSNPGHPRDRREYLPLYYNDFVVWWISYNVYIKVTIDKTGSLTLLSFSSCGNWKGIHSTPWTMEVWSVMGNGIPLWNIKAWRCQNFKSVFNGRGPTNSLT